MKSEVTYAFALAVLLISAGAQSGGRERLRGWNGVRWRVWCKATI